MPHKVDFTKVTNVKTIKVNPKGWVSPLFVEYGLFLHYNVPSYFWRVKGTDHTFTIPIARFEFLSAGDYSSHFEEALEGFRGDYLDWKDLNFTELWMKEYKKEFSSFII